MKEELLKLYQEYLEYIKTQHKSDVAVDAEQRLDLFMRYVEHGNNAYLGIYE